MKIISLINYAPDYLLGFYTICVFVVLKFEGILNGALCLCERERAWFSEPMLSKVRPSISETVFRWIWNPTWPKV